MRALVVRELGPPDRHAVETVADPRPGPGEVLVEVRCAALNFLDTLIIRGLYQVKPPLPFCPGGECAGVVAAVGDGVARIAPGDRVMAMTLTGAFAERVVVPADRVVAMPDGMDFRSAAGFLTAYATSYHALRQQAELQPDETMLVLGAAGGVGRTAVELGALFGANVIAAAGSSDKLGIARDAGATSGIDYTNAPLRDRVSALTKGRGVDVVYDPVGGDLAGQALRSLAWGGRYLVVGFAAGTIPSFPLNLVLLRALRIIGVYWGGWVEQDPSTAFRNTTQLLALYSAGKLSPLVSAVHPLDDFVAAFEALSNRAALGKVVIEIG